VPDTLVQAFWSGLEPCQLGEGRPSRGYPRMKTVEAIIATTHLDLHNERFTRGALQSMAAQARGVYIPAMVEHDIRRPVIGRTVSTRVVQLPDGEYGLLATSEMFDESDTIDSVTGDGRRMKVRAVRPKNLHLTYDRMLPHGGEELVRELADAMDDKPEEEGKKALEPIAVLTLHLAARLALAAALGAGAKAGADAWEKLQRVKDILVRHFAQGTLSQSVLLDIIFPYESASGSVEVHILLDKEVRRKVGQLFDRAFALASVRMKQLPIDEAKVHCVVFEFDGENLELRYAVREDCAPMTFVNNRPVLLLASESERLKLGSSPGGRVSREDDP
jgi:hypothetical protein